MPRRPTWVTNDATYLAHYASASPTPRGACPAHRAAIRPSWRSSTTPVHQLDDGRWRSSIAMAIEQWNPRTGRPSMLPPAGQLDPCDKPVARLFGVGTRRLLARGMGRRRAGSVAGDRLAGSIRAGVQTRTMSTANSSKSVSCVYTATLKARAVAAIQASWTLGRFPALRAVATNSANADATASSTGKAT